MDDLDVSKLPQEVRDKLAELDLELSEGDITQKGYEKKRSLILGQFMPGSRNGAARSQGSPTTRANRRHHRRVTRDESRFHSEIRVEAVQQALAMYSQGKKEKPTLIQAVKRPSESRERSVKVSDSSSDDDDSNRGSSGRSTRERRKKAATQTNGSSHQSEKALPPAPTENGAVEAMLRRVREQHDRNIQIQRDVDIALRLKDIQVDKRVSRHSRSFQTDSLEKVPSDEVVYVNTQLTEKDLEIPSTGDYQNAILPIHQSKKVSLKIQQAQINLQIWLSMSRAEPSPYAVTRICFPTLALQQKGRASPAVGSYRRLASHNHQDYLNERHSRKAASLKERKAKAAERQRLEQEEQVTRKISDVIAALPQQNSFDSEDGALRKVSSCPHSVGTISASSSFVRLPGVYHSPSSSREEYSDMSEYTVPWDCIRPACNNNEKEEVDRNYSIRMGRRGRMSVKKLNWLRPKSKPLHEFYNDDDAELEAMAKMVDPEAPRPEGNLMVPVRGESTAVNGQTLPRSIDSALLRFGTSTPKNVVGMVLDQAGKTQEQLTYAKLLSRSGKVAFMLLNKTISVGKDSSKVPICKPGDRVALIYPNTDPISFLSAFYGCILAGVVPVPMEVPLTKRDAGIQQLGFLLGSCGVRVALTSEACYKGLPKTAAVPTGPSTIPSGSNSLTGQATEIVDFKGWPRLYWVTTEHLPRPPRDWSPAQRVADESTAYIEYSVDKDGAVKGVCVSRQAMLSHCRSITTAMEYQEGDTMICVVDFKREVGLWHGVLASVFNGMRVLFVPYSVMKINPAVWMHVGTKLQASAALVKSRDLHWGLLASKDQQTINLTGLRSLVVADGANPWSLSSCDQFSEQFAKYGLRPDAMCPCAGSSETGTISLRRRTPVGISGSGRGVLKMQALSHGVVRVDSEDSITSLVIQDAGTVIPGGVVVVVKQSGPPRLCKADEVGEIAICAHSTGHAYWGLDGQSTSTFKVEPLGADDRPLGPLQYVRSGMIGFMGPDGMVFVVGRRANQLSVSGRQHSSDDIIATVLAVEPMKFIYRGRIAVFSVNVLRDERIIIVAEQKPGSSEDDAFNWMAKVIQATETIHQVSIYCLALVAANQLPKTPLGGIHNSETRQRFLNGDLHPCTITMCPHNCVLNLPKPRERQSDVGPAAIFVGNIVQGVRIAGAQGRSLGNEEDNFTMMDVLRSRAASSPDHRLFTLVTNKNPEQDSLTCSGLLKKAERVGALLTERARLNPGDHVALIFPPGTDLIVAFYGCLSAGVVPVCIRPPQASNLQATLSFVRLIVDASQSVAILSNSTICKLLRSKEAAHSVDAKVWPLVLDMEDLPSSIKRKTKDSTPERRGHDKCYLDFTLSTTGQVAGAVVSTIGATSLCKSLKLACELYPSRHVVLCLDPYSGIEFALWCLSSVYSGHHTTLIPPSEVEAQPALWLTTVSNVKARDTFTSYNIMDLCVRDLTNQVPALKEKQVNLSCVRTCVAVAEGRPRTSLVHAFSRIFAPLGLQSRSVSTSFGCRVNPAICMQGASGPDPSTVYVDARALRNDRVTLVGKGAPHSLPLMESGKIMPGVKIVIANPETRGQCADSHLGEIWISSPHNAMGYSTGGEETSTFTDHFTAKLTTGDTKSRFARTGYLGFLRQTQAITEDGELHDAVFVVGALEETLLLRGMRYHPVDIETTVSRCHRLIGECAVFTWNHLLVVIAECTGTESEALDIVPAVTSFVLEEHHLIVGAVVIVDPKRVTTNSRGEKQRNQLRDQFLKDQLNPIYVAYNT